MFYLLLALAVVASVVIGGVTEARRGRLDLGVVRHLTNDRVTLSTWIGVGVVVFVLSAANGQILGGAISGLVVGAIVAYGVGFARKSIPR